MVLKCYGTLGSMAEIKKVIKLVKKEVQKYENPVVAEIGNKSPFHVLISCILSLRTRDETTAHVSSELFKKANTPNEILHMKRNLEKTIRSVNYYKTKSKRIREICKILAKRNNKVPETMDDLLELPGVGRKTANIVLVYGFGKEGMPVDTHVHRIPNRLGWVNTKKPEQTEDALRKIIPKKYWKDFNDIFVTFGQNVCKPVSPKCEKCPVTIHCDYYKNKGYS